MPTNDPDRQESCEHSHTTEFHVPEDDVVVLTDGGGTPRPRDHLAEELPTDREVALAALDKLVTREHINIDTELRNLRSTLTDTKDGRQVPDPRDVEEVVALLADLQETLEENLHPIAYREE